MVQGLGWPSLASILLKWFPKERLGKNWGLCTTAGNLGQTMAPLALSSLMLLYGWKAAFLVPAALGCGMSVLVWYLVRDSPSDVGISLSEVPQNLDTSTTKAPKEEKLGLWSAFVLHILPDARIWLLCMGSALCYLVLKGLANWTIQFLIEARHFSKMQAASATTAFEGGGIIGSNVACWLSDSLGGRRNLASFIFTLVTIPCLLMLWLVPDAASADPTASLFGYDVAILIGLVASFGLGFCCNGPKATCGIALQETAHPKARGTASGILGLCGQIGASIAGYPLVMLQKDYGWAGVFAGLGTSGVVAAIIFVILSLMEGRKVAKKDA